MSGFDTNPFADPVDINPFQVGAEGGRLPLGATRPGRAPVPAHRDVALSEAPLANGRAAPARLGQSEGGGGTGGREAAATPGPEGGRDPVPETRTGPGLPLPFPASPPGRGSGRVSLLWIPIPVRGRGSRTPSVSPSRRAPPSAVTPRVPPALSPLLLTTLDARHSLPSSPRQALRCLSGCTTAGNARAEVLLKILHPWSSPGRAAWWSGCPLGLSGCLFKALKSEFPKAKLWISCGSKQGIPVKVTEDLVSARWVSPVWD